MNQEHIQLVKTLGNGNQKGIELSANMRKLGDFLLLFCRMCEMKAAMGNQEFSLFGKELETLSQNLVQNIDEITETLSDQHDMIQQLTLMLEKENE